MLEFCNVTRVFPNNKGIFNNCWKAQEGEVVGFIGHNGCGKTTTLKIIAGLQLLDEGKIKYSGSNISSFPRRIMGLVCEQRSLYQDIQVNHQLKLVCNLQKVTKSEINEQIDKWLSVFNLLEYKYTKIRDLSKGNQQLVQISCGLIHNPKIILLDEPFNGLDESRIGILIKVLKELSKDKIILVAFHQVELKEKLCDRVILLNDGKIITEVLS